jgi:pyrophosphate--fructose-6-phosphate 1-phosphotransferase
MSVLQKLRLTYQPKLPSTLSDIRNLVRVPKKEHSPVKPAVAVFFPKTAGQPPLLFAPGAAPSHPPLRVAVLFSGGQAAGGHNVIGGLYDALKTLHADSRLFGFTNGPKGLIENTAIEITEPLLAPYRNQGGFDLIGSGRTKIETAEQFAAALEAAQARELDGIVIIGGDDSNTNAAFLAEYFLQQGSKTAVIGMPKTIDGDLKSGDIEIPFGFDTAVKTYSEIIGNILRDALSAKKSYYFIRLMGRSASHITLECALQTRPNMAIIAEEVAATKKTLSQLTVEICDLICRRAEKGKDYGAILVPEGLIEFIPEFKVLISELNHLLAAENLYAEAIQKIDSPEERILYISRKLSLESKQCLAAIPREIQNQLLMDRDSHGNVQVSKIETERLLMEMVRRELEKRKVSRRYIGTFSAQPLFLGYEGRSALPSNFDAQYCYALGHVAALLVNSGATGYIGYVSHLGKPVEQWQIGGAPLTTLMDIELKKGQERAVVTKVLVDMEGALFCHFKTQRALWEMEDDYGYPGPIQFFGPAEVSEWAVYTSGALCT